MPKMNLENNHIINRLMILHAIVQEKHYGEDDARQARLLVSRLVKNDGLSLPSDASGKRIRLELYIQQFSEESFYAVIKLIRRDNLRLGSKYIQSQTVSYSH